VAVDGFRTLRRCHALFHPIALGSLAGSIDILQRPYLGVPAHNGVLWIDPAMPEALGPIRFGCQFRRNELEVEATGNRLQIKSASKAPSDVAIGFRGERRIRCSGESISLNSEDER
jgi:trehalose/maltose hydrolase-like predicted phosphorylase